jgi:hypothetical protein
MVKVAKPIRKTVAAIIQIRIARPLFCGQARRRKSDDNRVVPGEHKVDHHDFEQCCQSLGSRENLEDLSQGHLSGSGLLHQRFPG